MKVDVVLGLQWGDEGKGKIVDVLTPHYDVVARFQGGPNAGHSLEFNGKKFVLNTIPSGIFHEHCINIIGNGVVVDPVQLRKEIEKALETGVDIRKNLYISEKAHVILPTHRLVDAASEAHKGEHKVGSTLRGISPTYQDKIGRSGMRIGDLMHADFKNKYRHAADIHCKLLDSLGFEYNLADHEAAFFDAVDFLKQFKILNTEYYVNDLLSQGKKVLAEGAQGTLLDIDFGSYPFVTSSNTITGGACTGLGIAPQLIDRVFGIFKAYSTRVGNGPFPTEQENETGEKLRQLGHEFGATTGRPRRTGWLDLPALRYAIMLNGVTDLICTKSDVLSGFEEVLLCESYLVDGQKTAQFPYDLAGVNLQPDYKTFPGWQGNLSAMRTYDELPETFRQYIEYVEAAIDVPMSMISVGPDREETIARASLA